MKIKGREICLFYFAFYFLIDYILKKQARTFVRNNMYYIEDIALYGQLNNEFPLIKRKAVLDFDELLNNTDLTESDFREEIVYDFINMNDEQRKAVTSTFSNNFFPFIFDEEKSVFYKIVKEQYIPFNEHEKDLLFIVSKLFTPGKKSIFLNFSHSDNNKLYEVLKNNKNILLFSNNLNWLFNFHPYFDIYSEQAVNPSIDMNALRSRYKPVCYVEGSQDKEIYSLLFPDMIFIVENGSANIIKLMRMKKASSCVNQSNIAIIDSDAYCHDAIEAMFQLGIHTIPFSELENICIHRDCLHYFFNHIEIEDLQEKIIKYAEHNFESIYARFVYRQQFYKNSSLPSYNKEQLQIKKTEFLEQIKNKNYNSIILWLDGKNVLSSLGTKKIDIKIIKKQKSLQHTIKEILKLGAINEF